MKASMSKFLKAFYKKSKRGTIKASRFTKKWWNMVTKKKKKEKKENIDPVEMKKRELKQKMEELQYTESNCIVPDGMAIDIKPNNPV